MSSRLKHGLLISIAVIALFITVEYGYGAVIDYNYDASGNLIEKRVRTDDITPPTTTPDHPGGTYFSPVDVTLSCQDGTGSGCDKTYCTTNGTPPTLSTPCSSPIHISVTTILKFFSRDRAGNAEPVKTHNYTMAVDTTPPTTTPIPAQGTYNAPLYVSLNCSDGSGSGCDSNKIYYTTDGSSWQVYKSPIPISVPTTLRFYSIDLAGNSEAVKTQTYTIATVRIGGSAYTTLQAAYDVAVSGDVIKCRAMTFVENLKVNRNVTVTLDGGYDSGFTTNVGGQTTLKGKITTTVGGGKITIKNFVISQ